MLIFISTTITKSTLLPDPVFVANKIAVSIIIMIIERYCKFILLMWGNFILTNEFLQLVASQEKLGSIENQLKQAISLYKKRLEWLTTERWAQLVLHICICYCISRHFDSTQAFISGRFRGGARGPGPPFLWNIWKRFIRKWLKWAFKSHFKGFWAPSF